MTKWYNKFFPTMFVVGFVFVIITLCVGLSWSSDMKEYNKYVETFITITESVANDFNCYDIVDCNKCLINCNFNSCNSLLINKKNGPCCNNICTQGSEKGSTECAVKRSTCYEPWIKFTYQSGKGTIKCEIKSGILRSKEETTIFLQQFKNNNELFLNDEENCDYKFEKTYPQELYVALLICAGITCLSCALYWPWAIIDSCRRSRSVTKGIGVV